jgi:hypothetical protein
VARVGQFHADSASTAPVLRTPLIETARLRGEDPGDYLLRAALAAIENPGTVTLPNSSD